MNSTNTTTTASPESATRDRYAAAAHAPEAALCCPVDYGPPISQSYPNGSHRKRLRLRRPIKTPPPRRNRP